MKKLGLLAVALASGSAMADISVGGFVDTQFSWGSSDASKTNTFRLNDAAIYVNGSLGDHSAGLDIPVHALDLTGTTNTFTLGASKAQAWVGGKYSNGFHWNMGQFDALVGSEGKDTADIPFTTHSDITNSYPWTHMGLRLGYMINADWDFDVLVADPYNKSFLPKDADDATDDAMFDFGVRLKGKMTDMNISEFSGTFIMSNNGTVKPWIAAGILGLDFGNIHMRGDGFIRSSGVDGAKSNMGLGGYTVVDFSDMYAYGVRFTLTNGSSFGTQKFTFTTGPQFKLTKNFTTKLDYTFAMSHGETSVKSHAINLAGVYKF